MLVASVALLLALAATTAAQPAEPPLLAARSDGTWLVIKAIHEEPPPLAAVTDGLVVDEEDRSEARAAEGELEAAAQRAFEEAVDAARREPHS